MLKRLLAAAMAILMAVGVAQAETTMLAISVGKGDALLIQSGNYTCLVDTGKKENETEIRRALKYAGVSALDAVFITHTDKDHVGGLKWLRKSEITIGEIYASAYYPESTSAKHPAVKAAEKLGMEVNWLKAGDSVPLGESGAVFRVLAPEYEIPGNEDDNSLVMMLESSDGRMLLAGDMEFMQEQVLLSSGADLRCDVLKVPNHADTDVCSNELIAACGAKIAVISTSSDEKPDTPAKRVLKGLKNAGSETYITENCKIGVLVRMNAGSISAEYINK